MLSVTCTESRRVWHPHKYFLVFIPIVCPAPCAPLIAHFSCSCGTFTSSCYILRPSSPTLRYNKCRASSTYLLHLWICHYVLVPCGIVIVAPAPAESRFLHSRQGIPAAGGLKPTLHRSISPGPSTALLGFTAKAPVQLTEKLACRSPLFDTRKVCEDVLLAGVGLKATSSGKSSTAVVPAKCEALKYTCPEHACVHQYKLC
jgi:hypothetical protein